MAQRIDRDFVMGVGAQVLAAQLAGMRDPSATDPGHLDAMADMAVRAAMALDAAVPRAEQRLVDEEKAAEDAARAEKDAEDAGRRAAEVAAQDAARLAARPAAAPGALDPASNARRDQLFSNPARTAAENDELAALQAQAPSAARAASEPSTGPAPGMPGGPDAARRDQLLANTARTPAEDEELARLQATSPAPGTPGDAGMTRRDQLPANPARTAAENDEVAKPGLGSGPLSPAPAKTAAPQPSPREQELADMPTRNPAQDAELAKLRASRV